MYVIVDIIRTDVCFNYEMAVNQDMDEATSPLWNRPKSITEKPSKTTTVMYCRIPGLLAEAVREKPGAAVRGPRVVAEGRVVRDACSRALASGVKVRASITQARRLCPLLLVVPLEAVDARRETGRYLDTLADLSPVVEPDGPDTAYVDVTRLDTKTVGESLKASIQRHFGLQPVLGFGHSRLAARACAECVLPPDSLGDADVAWLWPEDEAVIARLKRLGLNTFGQVSAVSEEALRLHFGRIAPLLCRRAQGDDLTPVRSLYPPPRADARLVFDDFPLSDRSMLETALRMVTTEAAVQLRLLGRHGRRVVLRADTEAGERRGEWLLPAPIQSAEDINRSARRLLGQMRLPAPVVGLRVLVDNLETPVARTPDLFARGPGNDPASLAAVQRTLEIRFGTNSLRIVSCLPRTARDERRASLAGYWESRQRAGR